ncbi:hypothetical protein CJ195_00425 [Bacillus sp. UMB0899]|uniref:PCYCGC motif-containing (lipo)protein n=1 Tax=Metabacillus schmidteae TaxID=2730405 RepID=UPI000C7FE566|nr:PCYCGC motif-containing (lipo)protein [Metabacillus schmidteae]PMC40214.1 hypothetical protein CJ195_00425 [Bacillus sp. UMB0899]
MRKRNIMVFALLGGVLTACSSPGGHDASHDQHEGHEVVSDIREETSSIEVLPAFLSEKTEDMQTIYQAAAGHRELLENMPCYCGCGETANHTSNYDCFIYENKENGAIVWDDHGTKCGVCLEIAAQSILDYQEGKSIKEIRAKIDNKYKEGYAEPTPTPEI